MRLAFVTPRFGPGTLGGSEAVVREAALGLRQRGHQVEVLTTCALDHYTWANVLPEGEAAEEGLVVWRFPVARHPSRAALKAQLLVQAGEQPDLDHQVSWLGFQYSLPGLFEHLARHGRGYDAVVFSPYLFWSTSACMPLVADRAVVIPCLHDEAYSRLEVLRPVFELPALVWFLSGPEHELAHRLGPLARRHSVTGAGVPVPHRYDPEGLRSRHGLRRPYLLYAGRREEGKGMTWLLGTFAHVVEAGHDVELVLLGKGDLSGPLSVLAPAARQRVVDLGYVSDADRDSAFAGALAYLQPSTMESFSRTVMESWLAGTPVLANAGSDVVAWHCARSAGGWACADGPEVATRVGELLADPAGATRTGRAGRLYVLENYSWPVVLDRMEASLAAGLGEQCA